MRHNGRTYPPGTCTCDGEKEARTGSHVAYVSAVRFAGGTIWKANVDEVLEQMRRFQKDLQAKDLEDRKE